MPATDWAPWASREPSMLAHHGTECCSVGRAWFLAMDRSLWRGQGAPGWITQRYDWGPTHWPLHWCEAVGAKELCCGANSALTFEAFRGRGMDAVPVQLVQRYERHNLPHWQSRWTECGANPTWAADDLVYHEACAVVEEGIARVWNPTSSVWASPEEVSGYASIVAIRLGGGVPSERVVSWGALRLRLGEWTSVAEPVLPG